MRSAQFRTFILNQKGKRREERSRQISIVKDAKASPPGGGQHRDSTTRQTKKEKEKINYYGLEGSKGIGIGLLENIYQAPGEKEIC